MASGKMKSFSSAGKLLMQVGMISAICSMPKVMADEFISGAHLKDHVRSVLMTRGLDSSPVISDTRRFRACKAPFQVTPMFGGYKTVRLTCPDVDGFKIAVRTQIDSLVDTVKETKPNLDRENGFEKFVVLTKSLQTGEIIGADDVRVVSRDANPGVGYFRNINDVVGRKVKRAININQIIRSRHLELDYAIQKDQSVLIESKIGLVTVVSVGVAVDSAQLGELVKVKNNASGLIVEGVAMSEKKIRIRAK
jgi:flagella basal body P-ring formation protein FlgA